MDDLEDVDNRVLAVPIKRKRKGSTNSTKSNGKRPGNRERTPSGASVGSTRYSINPNTQYTDSEELEMGDEAEMSGSDASDLEESVQVKCVMNLVYGDMEGVIYCFYGQYTGKPT